ncbi:MAG: MFS transporter [Chloroflexi bacterium]|nr:MFS transporter [Chloroflexota bacterium]
MKETNTPVARAQPAPALTPQARRSWWRMFSALRHRNYRLYWIGMLVAIIGWQIQFVAQGWLVYDLTRDPAMLGLVGMAQAVPTILLNLFGGVVADRVDRRKLLIFTQSVTGLLMLVLTLLVATELVQVWHILAIAFLIGAVWAFDQPTRMALVPHLVARDDLMNAVAMGSIVWQGSRVVGPSLAGVLIATVGMAACFLLTTLGMLVMVGALIAVRVPKVLAPAATGNAVAELFEGVRYVLTQPLFLTLIGMTFFNSLFGMSYVILMPALARDVLGVGSEGYGFLMGAGGVGAVMGTLVVAALGNFRRKGWLILGGAAAFGAFILLFSLSRWYLLSLGLLFLMGGVQALYMTTMQTALQTLVPDALRGRVMGLYSLTWSLMPLGGMVGGAVAVLAGTPFAVGLGGSFVLVMALAMVRVSPQVRRLS